MGGAHPDQVKVREAKGPAPHSDAPFVTFTDVTKGSGLDAFRLHAGTEPPKNWIVESIGGGIVAFDHDGDGDVDLCLVDGDGMSPDGEIVDEPGSGTRLFRNDGGFRFTDVTEASGLRVTGYGLGGAAADWDGDGHADLCVVGYDLIHLYRNRGDGTFEDVTAKAGIVPRKWDPSHGCAWGDLDGDGRLDLYVANYCDQRAVVESVRAHHPEGPRHCNWRGHKVFCGPRGLKAVPNRLFFQREGGQFEDVTATHTVEPPRQGFQPVMSDLDGDGDLDVYVANDGIENTLLENDGKGRLRDRGIEAGAATDQEFDVQGSMGVAAADHDHDGRMDLFVTNFANEYNTLYRNRTRPGGRSVFEDVSIASRFCRSPHDRVCWGVVTADFDNDAQLDCFIAAGHVYIEDEQDSMSRVTFRQKNQMLRNLGGPKFPWEDVSSRAGPHFADRRVWRGAVGPDLDDDGDPDLVVTAQLDPPVVLRNDGGEKGSWLRLDLRDRRGTPAGAWATLTLADGSKRHAEVRCGTSFGCSDDPRLLFGLGKDETVPRVDVRWPGGKTTTVENVKTRQTLVLTAP